MFPMKGKNVYLPIKKMKGGESGKKSEDPHTVKAFG